MHYSVRIPLYHVDDLSARVSTNLLIANAILKIVQSEEKVQDAIGQNELSDRKYSASALRDK